jgi:hypothetical protein
MYDCKVLERNMSNPMKKTAWHASSDGDRPFPPEAFGYEDDVTGEAVASLREKAAATIQAEEWEVVDGFGLSESV